MGSIQMGDQEKIKGFAEKIKAALA